MLPVSEERFDRLENQINQVQSMMEQLIKMVGTNNTVTEELRQDINEIKTTMATEQELATVKTELKADIASLDTKIDRLAVETQEDVKAMLLHIEKKADNIGNKLDVLNDRTFENEADIRYLKKAR